jgi:hypothetical protein
VLVATYDEIVVNLILTFVLVLGVKTAYAVEVTPGSLELVEKELPELPRTTPSSVCHDHIENAQRIDIEAVSSYVKPAVRVTKEEFDTFKLPSCRVSV